MTGAHLHLALNHFPIVGVVIAILVIAHGLYWKQVHVLRVGLAITVFTGVLGAATYFTGEPAEHVIENRAGFKESRFEEHEQAALFAIIAIGLTATASAGGLYLSVKKNRIPKPLIVAIVILHIWTLTVIARTNYLGATISHPELSE